MSMWCACDVHVTGLAAEVWQLLEPQVLLVCVCVPQLHLDSGTHPLLLHCIQPPGQHLQEEESSLTYISFYTNIILHFYCVLGFLSIFFIIVDSISPATLTAALSASVSEPSCKSFHVWGPVSSIVCELHMSWTCCFLLRELLVYSRPQCNEPLGTTRCSL